LQIINWGKRMLRSIDDAHDFLLGEGGFFAGSLNLKNFTCLSHHDIHIQISRAVFDIVEIEEGIALVDAGADGGDGIEEGVLGDFFGVEEFLDREAGGEVGAGD